MFFESRAATIGAQVMMGMTSLIRCGSFVKSDPEVAKAKKDKILTERETDYLRVSPFSNAMRWNLIQTI